MAKTKRPLPRPIAALERAVQRSLTPELLNEYWADYARRHPGSDPLTGHCATATAAFWRLAGATEGGWRQRRLTAKEWPEELGEGDSHYWVEHPATGLVVDPTAAQFGGTRIPYERGRGASVPALPGLDPTGIAIIKKEAADVVNRIIATQQGQRVVAAAQEWSFTHAYPRITRENPSSSWPPRITRWTVTTKEPVASRLVVSKKPILPLTDKGMRIMEAAFKQKRLPPEAVYSKAVALLADVFMQERDAFRLPEAGLGISGYKVRREEARDYAVADPDTNVVWFHPAALTNLTDDNLRALVRHELAHLRNPYLSEAETDRLAEVVGGDPIYYDENDVQTLAKGVRPRPKRLPK